MSEPKQIVTIDGPSGVGKSTISRGVAARLNFTYLDTGAMYRAVAWHVSSQDLDIGDEKRLSTELEKIRIELLPAQSEEADVVVLLNGEDISEAIRSPEMSMLASRVSAVGCVREKLTRMQQAMGDQGGLVAEGRDMGTIVFPEARFKFFLEASPEERTRRRAAQLRSRGETVDEKKLLEMTITRDRQDREREIAPLRKAEDALLIDTTELSINQVLEAILITIKKA